MDHINRMRLFARLVEIGSFSGAGKAEGVAQSTVSKEMVALEARLGAQLIRRSPRGLSVTEAGRRYYDFAVGMLADLDAAEDWIRSGQVSPKGRLRVAAPAVISSELLAPRLGDFFERYPDLSVDLEVSERYVSLVEEGVDVAIRIGELEDSSLIARQIGALDPVVVASPAYLEAHGAPKIPADLERHVCLPYLFEGASRGWRFRSGDSDIAVVPPAQFRTNDAASVRAAALAGLGLAQGPTWLFAQAIEDGRLTPLMTDYKARRVPIHAITSGGRRMTGATKAFVDFVAEAIQREPHLRVR